MNRLLLIALFLMGVAILFFLCAKPKIPAIVANCTNTSYSDTGIDWAEAIASRSAVILRGQASSAHNLSEALDQFHACEGNLVTLKNELSVTAANPEVTTISVAPKISPYVLSLHKTADRILRIHGYVPTTNAHTLLLSNISQYYPETTIIDELEVVAGAPDSWMQVINEASTGLSRLIEGRAEMIDNELTISGSATSQGIADTVQNTTAADGYRRNYAIKVVAADVDNLISEAASCQDKFNTLLTNEMIHFETGKAIFVAESEVLLQALWFAAEKCPNVNITIEGHTDNLGSESDNERLSNERAAAVISYLVKKGVSAGRLKATGYGESQPIADNNTEEGRELNRRIEFLVGQ